MQQYKRIVVFGDSLQDNGNVVKTLGAPVAPYYYGHFSNGRTPAGYLAERLGERTGCTPSILNYAYGGAMSSGRNPKKLLRPHSLGVREQFQRFVSQYGRFGDQDLVIMNGGANNLLFAFYDEPPYINLGALRRLQRDLPGLPGEMLQAGAASLLIWTVPDITATPCFQGMPVPKWMQRLLKHFYRSRAAQVNKRLYRALSHWQWQYSHARIRLFDSCAMLQGVQQNPESYGFNNVTAPCVHSFGGFDAHGHMQSHIPVIADPETHLFWDWVHPVGKANKLIAEQLYALLESTGEEATDGDAVNQ